MTNIAMPAVHPTTAHCAGKNPAKGDALAAGAKSDFRQHLVALKTAKPACQSTRLDKASEDKPSGFAETAAAGDKTLTPEKPDAVSPLLATLPRSCGPANIKTAKPTKKELAAQAQTSKEASWPTTTQAAAATAPAPPSSQEAPPQPPGDALPAIAHTALQAHAEAAPTVQAGTFAKTPTGSPMQANQAGTAAPTAIAATQAAHSGNAPASNAAGHKAAPHSFAGTSGIAAQLADALPQQHAAKPGAGLALHIALKPQTLGAVTIKIQHDSAGATNVTITARQPETLETLKKDVANLNQILTNAGVPEAGRQIDFRAAPVAATHSNAGLGNAADPSMQGNSGGEQAPQNGMGFAHTSKANSATAASPIPAAPTAPQHAIAGSVDMIA